jgi:Xaa-Pro aminopeptidase
MTGLSASASLSERLGALTNDQRQGLAQALYVAQWVNTVSYSRLLEHAEVEALKLREYSRSLYQAVCRLAQLPAGTDEQWLDLVLASLELAPAGKLWGVRGKLWDPARTTVEVHVLDQPGRSVALVLALVGMARSVLDEAECDAIQRFQQALGQACDDLEEALYPEPSLDEKIAGARVRHERAQQAEGAAERAAPDYEPEPSFHGMGREDEDGEHP